MSDNIEKKVLVSIDVANQAATAAVEDLKNKVDELKASVIANKQAISDAKAADAQYSAQLKKGKVDQQAIKKAIDETRLATLQANLANKEAKKSVEAAAGSYAEAQQRLTALGKAIKNTEGGFNSSNKAIQKQIQEYNKLNSQLKTFDAKLGNHQRNVGNYESALGGLKEKLGSLIPGFSEASNALQMAAKGFNAIKTGGQAAEEGAAGAGEGIGEVAGAASGAIAIVAALVVVFIALAKHFADLTPNSDMLAQRFAYLKGLLRALAEDNMDETFGKWASSMHKVAQEAANIKEAMQDLSRSLAQDEVDDAKADAKVADLMLKMRNRRNTPEQERAYFNEIQKISQDKYQGNVELANKEYALAVRTATNSSRFSEEEKKRLLKDGVDYAIILDKTKGLVNGEDDIKAIVSAQQKQIATARERQLIQDRALNRLDASDMKAEAAAEKAKNDLLEAKRGAEELINEKRIAIAKIAQDQMEAFGKELSMNDEQYRQLLFKEQDFIKKQEQLRNKTKSPAAKKQFTKNISSANELIGLYGKQHSADQEKIITDFFKKQAELIEKGQDELANIQISNIKDVTKRELAALDQQHQVQIQGYSKEQNQLSEDISKTRNSLKKAKGEEKTALEHHLQQLLDLQGLNQDKSLSSTKKYEQDKLRIKRDAAKREQDALNEASVIKTGEFGSSQNIKANYAALQKQLDDDHDYNAKRLSDHEITEAEFARIDEKYIADTNALKYKAAQDLVNFELDMARKAADGAFSIIQSGIQREAQAREINLNKQKTFELNNKAATSTQKTLIEQKYQKLEGQAKVKEFKANQKLSIAKAIVDGALAIVAAEVQPYIAPFVIPSIIATTAAQIGVIAAQKPPAFAQGGTFKSDGKGAILPGYSKTDNINAHLRSGEGIIVSEAMQNPVARSIASSINQAFGGRSFDGTSPVSPQWLVPAFATGGIMSSSYLPTVDNGVRPSMPVTAYVHPDDLNAVVGAIMNMPPPQVDVKDIAYQQGRISSVVDRANY